MTKQITTEWLEDRLRDYQLLSSRPTPKRVLEEMEAGIGLHDIINICGLANNSSYSERTIRKCLEEEFKNKEIVEDILAIYYKLLFFPMLLAGEEKMATKIDQGYATRFGREAFRLGCVEYLGNLPYKLVSNFISLPILLNHYPMGGDIHKTAQLFIEIAEKNKKLSEFAEELGYTTENLDKIISKNLTKMKIGFERGILVDTAIHEPITFIEEAAFSQTAS